jgi:hypothetical protein
MYTKKQLVNFVSKTQAIQVKNEGLGRMAIMLDEAVRKICKVNNFDVVEIYQMAVNVK